MKKLLYCTYHSCFVSEHMAVKHDCFHKSNSGKVKRCQYLVNVFEQKAGRK